MKLLFIDSAIDGHHLTYLNSLIDCADETVLALPEYVDKLNCRQYVINSSFNQSKNFFAYFQWVYEIHKVIKKEKPDIVHFLYGDACYRFFGVGLGMITRGIKSVVIFHHIRRGWLNDISNRRIARCFDKVVVHTKSLVQTLKELKISNGAHIEYPQFSNSAVMPKTAALAQLGIDHKAGKILLALGGTRKDKGLDLLLEALRYMEDPFHLIIAGQEQTFKKEYIASETAAYKDKVSLILKYLTDSEFSACVNAADIIILPYRKVFDGASGPLGEGVALSKMIIGPDHGSIGDLIETYHLGITFEAENTESLISCIQQAIQSDWVPDEKYREYQSILSPSRFQTEYKGLYDSLLNIER